MKTKYDYCIIGSGPAGAFAAHKLASTGYTVAVVESGSEDIDMEVENFIDIDNSQIQGKTDFGFSRQIGGASNLWAGGLAKYDDVDFVAREDFGLPGWGLGFEELNKYYKEVDNYLKIDSKNEFLLLDKNSHIDAREMRVLDNPLATGVLLKHKNIFLLSKSSAIRFVLSDKSDSRISGIEFFDREEKKDKVLSADVFILGAGTISNVRVLLNSFNKNQLLCYDSIGRYISTHPKANIGYIELFDKVTDHHLLLLSKTFSQYLLRYQFGLSRQFLIDNKLLNHCIRFDSVMLNRAMRVFEMLKSKLINIPLVRGKSQTIAKLSVKFGLFIYRLIETSKFDKNTKGRLSVRGFFDQRARAENRIVLSSKLSEGGLPLAKINWNFDAQDWKNVDDFIKLFSEELTNNNIGKLVYQKPTEDEVLGVHSHYIGGTRMGENPENSVVDRDLKVHGLDNVYISGPSTFPSYGYANPFYTIAAMSLRLGVYLSNEK